MPDESLWRCPKCGRRFANRDQTHTCAALHDLDHHVAGREPIVREMFDLVVAAVRAIGPNDVDATFVAWLREAYLVGAQGHLA